MLWLKSKIRNPNTTSPRVISRKPHLPPGASIRSPTNPPNAQQLNTGNETTHPPRTTTARKKQKNPIRGPISSAAAYVRAEVRLAGTLRTPSAVIATTLAKANDHSAIGSKSPDPSQPFGAIYRIAATIDPTHATTPARIGLCHLTLRVVIHMKNDLAAARDLGMGQIISFERLAV